MKKKQYMCSNDKKHSQRTKEQSIAVLHLKITVSLQLRAKAKSHLSASLRWPLSPA